MATRHTYASTDDLRDYLAGTSYSSGWTADGGSIRRILEAASTRIDQYTGGGAFGPVTETRYYDISASRLVERTQCPNRNLAGYGRSAGNTQYPQSSTLVIALDGPPFFTFPRPHKSLHPCRISPGDYHERIISQHKSQMYKWRGTGSVPR